jgi:hypothetical protein
VHMLGWARLSEPRALLQVQLDSSHCTTGKESLASDRTAQLARMLEPWIQRTIRMLLLMQDALRSMSLCSMTPTSCSFAVSSHIAAASMIEARCVSVSSGGCRPCTPSKKCFHARSRGIDPFVMNKSAMRGPSRDPRLVATR